MERQEERREGGTGDVRFHEDKASNASFNLFTAPLAEHTSTTEILVYDR